MTKWCCGFFSKKIFAYIKSFPTDIRITIDSEFTYYRGYHEDVAYKWFIRIVFVWVAVGIAWKAKPVMRYEYKHDDGSVFYCNSPYEARMYADMQEKKKGEPK